MAEDTIDAVQEALGVSGTRSLTRNHVLYGGDGFTDAYWRTLCDKHRIPEDTARHLTSKFGTAAEQIVALMEPDSTVAKPIFVGHPAIQAEVLYSVRCEMAVTIEDVLARRGIELDSWRDAIDAAPVVGRVMAGELGWTNEFRQKAVADYVRRINYLLGAAGLPRKLSAPLAGNRSSGD